MTTATPRAGKATQARTPAGYIPKGNERYDRHDTYYRKAKQQGFVARSIFKLEEIDKEVGLFRASDAVVDLGCAPGSWLQYVEGRVTKGRAVGIDLLPTKTSFGPRVRVLQGDAFTTSVETLAGVAEGEKVPLFDVVLSDMAPNTTGIRAVDQARSMALCEHALAVAERVLRPGGKMVVKIFEGGDMKQYLEACKRAFETVKIKRPKSTREGSMETYVIAIGRKRAAAAAVEPA